jgi:hypothetical protein
MNARGMRTGCHSGSPDKTMYELARATNIITIAANRIHTVIRYVSFENRLRPNRFPRPFPLEPLLPGGFGQPGPNPGFAAVLVLVTVATVFLVLR